MLFLYLFLQIFPIFRIETLSKVEKLFHENPKGSNLQSCGASALQTYIHTVQWIKRRKGCFILHLFLYFMNGMLKIILRQKLILKICQFNQIMFLNQGRGRMQSFLECWSCSLHKRVPRFSFVMIKFIGMNND